MLPDELNDEQLLFIVGTTDKELFESGIDMPRRQFETLRAVMAKFGYIQYGVSGAGKPKILERIEAIFESIYSEKDLAVGGHIGVFMYRDIFARIGIPRAYGTVAIDPFEWADLTKVQLQMMNNEPDQIEIYIDQFSDVFDIQYGIEEINKPYCESELTVRFINLSRFQLHAAAAILTGGYDYRGASQCALLATELALKSAASCFISEEVSIKNEFGHNMGKIIDFIGSKFGNIDLERIKRTISTHPKYVENRYTAQQPSKREVGHLVMGAQYIVSEVVRQISDRNFRESAESGINRRYPE